MNKSEELTELQKLEQAVKDTEAAVKAAFANYEKVLSEATDKASTGKNDAANDNEKDAPANDSDRDPSHDQYVETLDSLDQVFAAKEQWLNTVEANFDAKNDLSEYQAKEQAKEQLQTEDNQVKQDQGQTSDNKGKTDTNRGAESEQKQLSAYDKSMLAGTWTGAGAAVVGAVMGTVSAFHDVSAHESYGPGGPPPTEKTSTVTPGQSETQRAQGQQQEPQPNQAQQNPAQQQNQGPQHEVQQNNAQTTQTYSSSAQFGAQPSFGGIQPVEPPPPPPPPPPQPSESKGISR